MSDKEADFMLNVVNKALLEIIIKNKKLAADSMHRWTAYEKLRDALGSTLSILDTLDNTYKWESFDSEGHLMALYPDYLHDVAENTRMVLAETKA